MSYKLTIVQKPAYLHAIVTGLNKRENVMRYLEEVLRVCTVRGCSRVLIEERLDGPRFGTVDVFEIASKKSRHAGRCFKDIAYVVVSAKGDLMKFAETVVVNCGLPVRVFSSVSEAEKWLLDQYHGGTVQDAHSMGGLVTRAMIARQPDHTPR